VTGTFSGPPVGHDQRSFWGRLFHISFGQTGLVAALSALVGAAAAVTAFVATPGRASPGTESLTIDALPDPVPRCVDVAGSGEIPGGWVLWVTVRDPKRHYYFDAPAAVDAEHRRWEVRNVWVGGENQGSQQFEIVTVLLDQRTSDFVKSATVYVGYERLPPEAVIADSVSRSRSSTDVAPCPE
jgi:hypothetical protein